MHDDFRGRADLYLVYICEAHPVDEWQTASNEEAGICIVQHKTFTARTAAARLCAQKLELSIPTLIDRMDNRACEAFSAWPERIYIIDCTGCIQYQSGPGPYEFRPDDARGALEALLKAGP